MKVGLVILAAGESKRMGMPKQLLPIYGISMLKYLLLESFETLCHPLTVVLGTHKNKIVAELKDMPISIIDNTNWLEGIGGSIKMGLIGCYMVEKNVDAILFLASDMPAVTRNVIKKMISKANLDEQKNFVVSKQNFAFPVLIKRPRFEELLDIKNELNLNHILEKHPDEIEYFDFKEGVYDINTKNDYFKFTQSLN